MMESGKSKIKILIAVICAVVVIAGAGVAVYFLRDNGKTPEKAATDSGVTDTVDTQGTEYSYEGVTESTTEPYTGEYSTDDDSNMFVTDNQGATSVVGNLTSAVTNVISTVKGQTNATNAAGNTTKAANSKTTTTTKAANGKTTTTTKASGGGFVENVIGDDAEQSFLGYRYSSDGYYYCDDKDNWQSGTGYNEVYDKWAPVAAMYIDQVRIRFQYENKNWMIQMWKGQYGYLLIGAEIGIYTCDLDEYSGGTGDINHFNCAEKEDWLMMQLDCYYCEGGNGTYKKIFTRPYAKYWWATGFVKGQLTKYTAPRTELKTKNRITFKSADQASIFVSGLKQSGFVRAGGKDSLVDDSYFQSGSDVWVLWSTKYSDCFVGYSS